MFVALSGVLFNIFSQYTFIFGDHIVICYRVFSILEIFNFSCGGCNFCLKFPYLLQLSKFFFLFFSFCCSSLAFASNAALSASADIPAEVDVDTLVLLELDLLDLPDLLLCTDETTEALSSFFFFFFCHLADAFIQSDLQLI